MSDENDIEFQTENTVSVDSYEQAPSKSELTGQQLPTSLPSTMGMETHQSDPRVKYSGKDEIEIKQNPEQYKISGRLVLGNQPFPHKKRRGNRTAKGGKDGICGDSEETVLYVTRHKIDHLKQSDGICHEVLFNECIPCCDPVARERRHIGTGLGLWMLWSIIRSEVFIYGLHIFSLVLGATKEGVSMREEFPNLELTQSVIETAATLLLLTIRMANAYHGYREVRSTNRLEENYHPDKDINVLKLKRWMITFMTFGAFLFVFSTFAFLWFYFHAHLGWTILTNNFSMITMYALATVFGARVAVILTRLREDQHKVVIHDAAIFIEGTHEMLKLQFASTTEDNAQAINVEDDSESLVFVRALRSTKLFECPSYIEY